MLWFEEGDVDVLPGLLPGSPASLRQFLASANKSILDRTLLPRRRDYMYFLIHSEDICIIQHLIYKDTVDGSMPFSLKKYLNTELSSIYRYCELKLH
jgi:hypothetical protein